MHLVDVLTGVRLSGPTKVDFAVFVDNWQAAWNDGARFVYAKALLMG